MSLPPLEARLVIPFGSVATILRFLSPPIDGRCLVLRLFSITPCDFLLEPWNDSYIPPYLPVEVEIGSSVMVLPCSFFRLL